MRTVLYSGLPNVSAQQGCRQFFFKYCSTFDSTAQGNIGPVAESLASQLGASQVVVCPAFPGTGRSVYQGHLFVNDQLLNESGMQNHPITPMTDSDLRRLMQAQCKASVGHVGYADVAAGSKRISSSLAEQEQAGHLFMVVDAISDDDLMAIGGALHDVKLITGGSGVAMGLPANFAATGDISRRSINWTGQAGRVAALSGSCSIATRNQIDEHARQHPVKMINVDDVVTGTTTADKIVEWVIAQDGIPLVFSSAPPEVVATTQAKHSQATASQALEDFFTQLAQKLVAAGITRLISAGGETSGAIVEGLALSSLDIGPEIDPGVPALRAGDNLVLALKSGNFGTPDFFEKAASLLGSAQGL